MSLEYWKAQAMKWKKAYWSTFDDTAEERKEILARARKKAQEKAKAMRKAKKSAVAGKGKKTLSKKPVKKTVVGEVLSLFD